MKSILLTLFLVVQAAGVFAQNSTDEALAAQYFQSGDYDKSLVLYRKLFTDSKGQNSYEPYINVLLKLKLFDEADKTIKKQIKANPGEYSYQVDYGRLLKDQGNEVKMTAWYDDLLKNLPKNEMPIRDLANTFYRANENDYAVKTFLTGRKLLNDNTAFSFDLVSLYKLQKNKSALIDEYLNILETSPEVLQQARNVLGNLLDGAADFELLKTPLLKKIQKNPQAVVFTELLTWQYLQQKDFDMALRQVIALDKRQKEQGDRVYELGDLLVANKAYTTAIDAYQNLIARGTDNPYYLSAKVQVIITKNQMLTSGKFSTEQLLELEKDYLSLLSEFPASPLTASAMQELARLQAFYLNKPKDAQAVLEKLLKINGVPASIIGQTKLSLGDIYILTGEVWEASLIYSQVEKQFPDQPLGQEAKFRNARLSYFQGDFTWSKAQVDVLKSSTSQLIANDALNLGLLITENLGSAQDTLALQAYSRADMLIFKNQLGDALAAFDSIAVRFPRNSLNDDVLMAKARIYIRQGDLEKAAAQLDNIATNYKTDLWADDAIFMLADLYETQLNDPEKAKSLFEKIITDYPASLFVIEARKRFRNLRGDKIGS